MTYNETFVPKSTTWKIILVIVILFATLPVNLVLLYGPVFLITVPIALVLILVLLFKRFPTFYCRFIIGFILEFGIVSSLMLFFEPQKGTDWIKPNLIAGTIGLIGLILVGVSIYQWVFNIKKFPKIYEIILNIVTTVAFLFCTSFVIMLAYLVLFPGPFLKK